MMQEIEPVGSNAIAGEAGMEKVGNRLDNVCLTEDLLRLSGSTLEHDFFVLIFPWLFAIGLSGNTLNLVVLLSPDTRRGRHSTNQRSNCLLTALAFMDILFFLSLVPHSLANFDQFGLDLRFRQLYFPLKMHLVAMANWCSAAAIWLVIVISAERLVGVRSIGPPPSRGKFFSCLGLRDTILVIVTCTGLITAYNHFSHHCVMRTLCHDTQVVSKCFDIVQESWPVVNGTESAGSHLLKSYVQWSQMANAVLVILLPIVLMAAMNIALLVVVKKRSFLMYWRLNSSSTASTKSSSHHYERRTSSVEEEQVEGRRKRSAASYAASRQTSIEICTSIEYEPDLMARERPLRLAKRASEPNPLQQTHSNARRSIDQSMQYQAEHRCTVTVVWIVTCFSLTQGPSALILLSGFLSGHQPPFVNSTPWWYNANTITGFLVIFGKTLNFILFCFSSTGFRRRLMKILKRKFPVLSTSIGIGSSDNAATTRTLTSSNASSIRRKRDNRRSSVATN